MNAGRLTVICAISTAPIAAAGLTIAPQSTEPIVWSATRRLDWTDFRAKPLRDLDGARSVLSYTYVAGCREGRLVAAVTALFLPDRSSVSYRIVSSGLASRVGLRHEQTHFDMKEAYARRARKMFAELATPCPRSDESLLALAERVFKEEAVAQERFEIETRDGENETRQLEWERRVASDLAALSAYSAAAPVPPPGLQKE